jgi:biotin operon repressor
MDKQQAIKLAGSQSELARLLGIHRTAVHQWKEIPKGRLYQLMVLRPEWFSTKEKA